MTRRSGVAALGAMGLVWFSVSPRAQEPAVTFRSRADVVLVPVWVQAGNRPVAGLTAADFQLLDNGVPQPVSIVEADTHPVDVTLVLDTSGSVRDASLARFKAGVQQIARSLRPDDRLRLLTFASGITDAFGVVPGGTPIPIDRVPGGGATSLYDAIAPALMTAPKSDRPQLVFGVSDGLDSQSFVEPGQLPSLAAVSHASLYLTIVRRPRTVDRGTGGPTGPVEQSAGYLRVMEELRDAAVGTGGLLFEGSPDAALPALFAQVLSDFRTSYLLSYSPTGVEGTGWHAIAVHTTDRRHTVRARAGYRN
jgi:hypothetical protein